MSEITPRPSKDLQCIVRRAARSPRLFFRAVLCGGPLRMPNVPISLRAEREQALLQVSADRASSQRVTGRCRYLPVFGIGRWKIGNCAVCSCIFSGTTVRRSRRLSGFMARTLPSAQARLRKVRVSSSSWPSWPSSRENEGFGAGTTGEQRQRHARKQKPSKSHTLCWPLPDGSSTAPAPDPASQAPAESKSEPTTAPGRLCALVQLCIPLHTVHRQKCHFERPTSDEDQRASPSSGTIPAYQNARHPCSLPHYLHYHHIAFAHHDINASSSIASRSRIGLTKFARVFTSSRSAKPSLVLDPTHRSGRSSHLSP